jgi:hypothetical protein
MIGWKQATWRGRLKLVAFSLIPVALILALAQACAYLTIHRTISITTDATTGLTHYSMRIGRWPWSHRSYTPLNSLGLPDDEFVDVLPKGRCVHVLFAGDSFTFGDATDREHRWTTLVAQMTARRRPERCIRFFNIGVRNTTIDTTIARIRQVRPLIEPDLVVLEQYQNDLTDLANPGSPAWVPAGNGRKTDSHWGARLGRLVPGYNVSLLRIATYQAFAYMIKHDIPYDVLGTWSVLEGDSKRAWADTLKSIYRRLYGSLVHELRRDGIEVVALTFPSKMDVLAQRSPEGVFWAELAREFDVPCLSLMPVLDANRAGMPFYLYDGHLNEFGNRVVAAAIWDWLFADAAAPVWALQPAGSRAPAAPPSPPRPCVPEIAP